MDRAEAITRIKQGLQRRSGRAWSVTGGRGTAWGWITVDALPSRRTWHDYLPEGAPDLPRSYVEREESGKPFGHMSPADRAELGRLLGLDAPCHMQGESIPAGGDYYREYVDRAEGRAPSVVGTPYWD